jgi:anti-sigma factor RsiW
MTPQKLFDYLDGKLPAQEREELEARMAKDSALLRQLAIARRLRETMPGSQEVIGSLEENAETKRGAILSRRVALAFIVLVFLNVFIGLWFIFQKQRPSAKARDASMRQQLQQSLEKAAASAMPTPNIEADEIKITPPAQQEEAAANKVIAAASAAGGSGAKALSDETGIVVLVDIPKNREMDFRQSLVALGAPLPAPIEEKSFQPNERKFLQVRVLKAEGAP